MEKQVELAFERVVRRVEPLTRFDRTSLTEEAHRVRVTAGKAFWRFVPHISNQKKESTGRLPYHAKRVDSSAELDEAARRTQQGAHDALPQRIQAWLRVNAQTDQKLGPSNCFDGAKTFGYEHVCHHCSGNGWIKCGHCDKGYNPCGTCSQKGRVDCPQCHSFLWGSTGKVKCKGCGGSRKKDGRVCGTCNGKGEVTCGRCGGVKTVVCGKCKGAGNITCSHCRGTGRLDCTPCDKTGFFHALRTVDCDVSDSFDVNVKDEKPEVVRQLGGRDLEGLRKLADVRQLPPTVQDTVVRREYDFDCVITEIRLRVAEQSRELLAFGASAQIFDYKAIVSDLLQSDLDELRQEIPKTPLRLWGNPAGLLNVTRQFLASELNAQVDDRRWVDENIVTETYVDEAKASLRVGLEKLFLTRIGLALLVSVLLPVVVFLVSHAAGWREALGPWVFAAPVAAAVAAWVLLEREARRRLMVAFGDGVDKKVDAQLRKYKILWKLRAAALVLTVVLLAIAANLPLP